MPEEKSPSIRLYQPPKEERQEKTPWNTDIEEPVAYIKQQLGVVRLGELTVSAMRKIEERTRWDENYHPTVNDGALVLDRAIKDMVCAHVCLADMPKIETLSPTELKKAVNKEIASLSWFVIDRILSRNDLRPSGPGRGA